MHKIDDIYICIFKASKQNNFYATEFFCLLSCNFVWSEQNIRIYIQSKALFSSTSLILEGKLNCTRNTGINNFEDTWIGFLFSQSNFTNKNKPQKCE